MIVVLLALAFVLAACGFIGALYRESKVQIARWRIRRMR